MFAKNVQLKIVVIAKMIMEGSAKNVSPAFTRTSNSAENALTELLILKANQLVWNVKVRSNAQNVVQDMY